MGKSLQLLVNVHTISLLTISYTRMIAHLGMFTGLWLSVKKLTSEDNLTNWEID